MLQDVDSNKPSEEMPPSGDSKAHVESPAPLQDLTLSQSHDPPTGTHSDFQQTGCEGGNSDGADGGGCVDGSGHCGGGDGKGGEGSGDSGGGDGGDGEGGGGNEDTSDSQVDSDLVVLSTVTSTMEAPERDG